MDNRYIHRLLGQKNELIDLLLKMRLKSKESQKKKWMILSLEEFVDFHSLKRYVLGQTIRDRIKDLNTLPTKRPKLNTMSYEEAMERKRMFNDEL